MPKPKKIDLINICSIDSKNEWDFEELTISPSLSFYIKGGGGMSHEYHFKITEKKAKEIIIKKLISYKKFSKILKRIRNYNLKIISKKKYLKKYIYL